MTHVSDASHKCRWSIARILGVLALLCIVSSGFAGAQTPHTSTGSSRDVARAADSARQSGDIEKSIALYERALAAKPGWQEGWWYYGSLLYDQNQYPQSVKAFRKLVSLNGKLGGAWAMLGLSEYECQQYDTSLADLQKAEAIGTDPESGLQNIVDYHLALLLNARGDSDGANLLLSSLFLRGVQSEDLQVALGLTLLRVPLYPSQISPSRDALVHDAGSAAALVAQKEYDKAAIAFDELLKRYPSVNFIHYAYGSMLASIGKDHEAEDQFRAETVLNPGSALAYMEWSFVESKTKHYAEALGYARQAVELSDGSFMAHYLLGNALLMSGDVASSVPQLVTARKLAPQSPEIRYSLSRAYARLGQVELARQEQTAFIELQRRNALDRIKLQHKYPSAAPITGVTPIAPE